SDDLQVKASSVLLRSAILPYLVRRSGERHERQRCDNQEGSSVHWYSPWSLIFQNVSAGIGTAGAVPISDGPGRELVTRRSSDFFPNRRNRTGVSTLSSRVALIRPPKIVTATGCRISLPGVAASMRSGNNAKPAESAVISTGVSRSRLPRRTSSRPNGSRSWI